MKKFLRKIIKIFFNRAFFVALLLLIQIAWMLVSVTRLAEYYSFVNESLRALSLLTVIAVVNTRDNPAYKIAWVIVILLFPLFGGTTYLLFSGWLPSKRLRKKLEKSEKQFQKYLLQKEDTVKKLKELDTAADGQSRYIRDFAGFPVWENSTATYYEKGESNYPVILEELKKAEHFIFLEYFIVQEGEMWNSIFDILKEKAQQGVDVRMLYDDLGSAFVLPFGYNRKMESYGIKCVAFNRFVPFFSLVMNNRDHRKILIIDGHTAFTGGINLADEYINKKTRFGYWKDTGIRIQGEAVCNLTAMFLTIWNVVRPSEVDFSQYLPRKYHEEDFPSDGFIQPYSDSPLDLETVGENVYLNMISSAREYLTIFTPYLIIDNEVMTALCLAAKRGVTVNIITPEKPDKKLIYWLTQSHYCQLMEAGVHIYQYLPGFIHAKVFLCDDRYATVGTINLDYRSLYLHFECGVFLCHSSEILKIRKDADETMDNCREITFKEAVRPVPVRLAQNILKIFAPLL